MALMVVTYRHDHPCEHEGVEYVQRIYSRDGAYPRIAPICDDWDVELVLVSTVVKGRKRDAQHA